MGQQFLFLRFSFKVFCCVCKQGRLVMMEIEMPSFYNVHLDFSEWWLYIAWTIIGTSTLLPLLLFPHIVFIIICLENVEPVTPCLVFIDDHWKIQDCSKNNFCLCIITKSSFNEESHVWQRQKQILMRSN